ncbi:MAG: TolC family protein [Mediterranea sp.]|jgi:outer membrane protein TolC|nr:TolC family protein [Mediterranea sp.]
MKAFLCILMVSLNGALFAQNDIETILASIDKNNITLKALREEAEAQKLANKTGIFLANPEAEFNYLWGSPDVIGNRTDVSIRQTFDIPTITGMKSRISNKQNRLVELRYKADRINILLQAKQCCMDLIYYDALKKQQTTRLRYAETIAGGYKKKLTQGDISLPEYNKALLNLSSVQGELSRIDVEQNAVLYEIKQLNGGVELIPDDYRYEDTPLPTNFADWYASAEHKNPVLEYVRLEVEVSKNQISLNQAMGLPSFSAGYMSEKVVGEHFQGITLGISIPLWENKNRVKQAKAASIAAATRQENSRQQFYHRLQNLYEQTQRLKSIADSYKASLTALDSTDLFTKALDAGEISVLEYVVEMGLYYDMVKQALEAVRL